MIWCSGTSTGVTVRPAATEATAAAIPRGLTSTRPWPIADAARSVSPSGAGTCPKYAGKPTSRSKPRPSEPAASASAPSGRLPPASMKAVLQLRANAARNVTGPSPEAG